MTSNRVLALQDVGGTPGALIERTVELAFTQLRLGRDATPETIEQVIDLVGSGALDAAIEAAAPPVEAQRAKRRFDEQQEFSHAAWKKRHGLDA